MARSLRIASAPWRLQRAPVRSMRSLTRWRQALLAKRPVLNGMIHQAETGRRDEALGVLQSLGTSIQRAMRQESETGLAATRALAAELETLLADARQQLDALTATEPNGQR